MADCVATGDSSLYVLPLIKDRISEYICKKCSAYESQLKEVLEELESAKTIINILQRELPTNTTTKNMWGEQTNTKEWTSVSSRNNSARPNKSKLCVPTTTDQHIMITNRFTPLYNLQANNVESNGLQTLQGQKKQTGQISTLNENKTLNQHRKGMKIPTIINGRLIHGDNWKPTTKRRKRRQVQLEPATVIK